MSDEQEDAAIRAAFEAWYARTAFDYVLSPIGSRDCSLQWKAWQEAHARGIVAGMRRAAEIAGDGGLFTTVGGIRTACAMLISQAADKLEQEQQR